MQKRQKWFVYLLSICMVLATLFTPFLGAEVALANDDEVSISPSTKISEDFLEGQYGDYQMSKKYYYIDSVSDEDVKKLKEDGGLLSDIADTLFGWTDVGSKISDKMNYILNEMVNLTFTANIFLTKTMLTSLESAYDFKLVDELIKKLDSYIPSMTGITGGVISGGIFGNLMGVITLLVGAYALYVYAFKRAFMDSLGVILKSIVLIAVAILLFSNYGKFLITANDISEEVSAFVLASQSNNQVDTGSPALEGAKDTLWSLFVDRPYLYMQYGTYDSGAIGDSRIKELMAMPKGEARYNYVLEKEVVERNNDLMINSSVGEKLAFSAFYLVLNGILSIPIYLLSFFLIMLQFWFLVVAAIAPFALLVALIPGFNGVAKRYFIELGIPLALKIFFSFFTLFVLVLSQIFYDASNAVASNSGGLFAYIQLVVLNAILFVTIFMIRKRIAGIFSSGSQVISGLRESAGIMFSPITGAVKAATTTGGAVVGGLVGGPVGAAQGASIGNSVGRAVTGQGSAGELANQAMRAGNQFALSKAFGNGKSPVNAVAMNKDNQQMLTDFLKQKGMDDETIHDTIKQFEKNGITEFDSDELSQNYDSMVENVQEQGLKQDFATDYANIVQSSRSEEKKMAQLHTLQQGIEPTEPVSKPISATSENLTKFALDKGYGGDVEMLEKIKTDLESKGYTDISYAELEEQHEKLQEQYENGNLNKDYATAMTSGIINNRKAQAQSEMNENIFANARIPQEHREEFATSTSITSENLNKFAESKGIENTEELERNDLNNSTFKTSTIEQSFKNEQPMVNSDSSLILTPIIEDGKIENSSMNEGSLNGGSFDNSSSMKTGSLDNSSLDNSSPMKVGSLGSGSSMKMGSLESSPGGSTMDSTPIGGGSIEGTPLGGSSMDSTPIGGSSIEGTSLGGSTMDSTPIGGGLIEGTPLGGSSMDSTPIKTDSTGSTSIENVKNKQLHNQAQNAYESVTKYFEKVNLEQQEETTSNKDQSN